MDVIDKKNNKELYDSLLAEIAKANNEIKCANADVAKAQNRLKFSSMVIHKLIDREKGMIE